MLGMKLICAAWNEELKAVKPDALMAPLGIGYLEAALELTRILNERGDIDEILFLGTCGSYNRDLDIGDVVSISSVQLLERGEVLGLAYNVREGISYRAAAKSPITALRSSSACSLTDESTPLPRTRKPCSGQFGDSSSVPCLCSLEITNSSELSVQILKHYGFTKAVENMELYGVARVASQRGIKWSARLGVTNYTNIEAHQDWLANHQRLSLQLGEALLQV